MALENQRYDGRWERCALTVRLSETERAFLVRNPSQERRKQALYTMLNGD